MRESYKLSQEMQPSATKEDAHTLREGLNDLPEPLAKPVLIVISGLPGTGKTFFSERLAKLFPCAILETDFLRRLLFGKPAYTAQESARLFDACHRLIEDLLSQGIPVILDATNLVESHRMRLYNIADRADAKIVLVRVEAPVETVRQRLLARASVADGEAHSDADWSVYKKMRPSAEPIGRTHYAVDTSRDITPVLNKIVRDIKRWLRA